MNIFRLAGDMTHLISILVLLLKIYATKSCSGVLNLSLSLCLCVSPLPPLGAQGAPEGDLHLVLILTRVWLLKSRKVNQTK